MAAADRAGGASRPIARLRVGLIADETAAHLDASGAAALMGELTAEARAGRAILVIAHEPHGLECFDEVLTLRHGRLD
jgi:ATP-binding cassette, subfamily C, bacterial CydD